MTVIYSPQAFWRKRAAPSTALRCC